MPFSLPDLKRAYGRSGTRGGSPDVRPYLLIGKELEARRETLARAIEWFERRVGRSRASFSPDDFAGLVGDYRLARCLASCLQVSFAFRAPSLEQVAHATLGDAARYVWHQLQEAGAASAAALRLHVFDAVNRRSGGCVGPDERERVLDALAEPLGCTGVHLDALLWSDAEQNEVLVQVAAAPLPDDLAAHYNRRALETLLVRCLDADLFLPHPDGGAIRRLYFAVKRAGLLCELSLHDPAEGARDGVWAHLFGPLEIFGPRTRHGDRFARAVLDLIRAFPELGGTARVLINEREYILRLPRGLGDAIRYQPPDDADGEAAGGDDDEAITAVVRRRDDATRFDSAIERHLFDTLRGMERRGDTRGWTVEREPEPIVHGPTVLVPDFSLTRPTAGGPPTRVFVEVIGFWTPAYRDRKKAKLLALGGSIDLVLVVDEQLAADFEALPYSVVAYRRRPSAHDLIMLLECDYPAAPARRPAPRPAPEASDDSARVEWEALFGSAATSSASPAKRDTPGAE